MQNVIEFVKTNRFWIIVGLLAVVSGVGFGVGFLPARDSSREKEQQWQGRASQTRDLAGKKLHSEEDIRKAEEIRAAYQSDVDRVMSELKELSALLEQHIPNPQTGKPEKLPPDQWKLVYAEQMQALQRETQKSFERAPGGLIEWRAYGARVPDEEEIRKREREYWRMRYVLEALQSINEDRSVAPILSSFSFKNQPERFLHPIDRTLFEPIPFTMRLATDFSDIPYVLAKLMECKLPVSITSISIGRRPLGGAPQQATQAPSGRPAGGRPARRGRRPQFGPPANIPGLPAGIQIQGPPGGFGPMGPQAAESPARGGTRPTRRAKKEKLPDKPLVNVSINGYALDFKSPAEGGEEQAAAE